MNFVTFNVGSTNKNSTHEHCYYPLASVKTKIKSKFDELLKQTDSKLTEIARIEKNAWKRLDTLEEECQKMTKNVEKNSKEQVLHHWQPMVRTEFVLKVVVNPYGFARICTGLFS